ARPRQARTARASLTVGPACHAGLTAWRVGRSQAAAPRIPRCAGPHRVGIHTAPDLETEPGRGRPTARGLVTAAVVLVPVHPSVITRRQPVLVELWVICGRRWMSTP